MEVNRATFSYKALRVLGWLELISSVVLLVGAIRAVSDLIVPSDPNPAHNEWTPMGVFLLVPATFMQAMAAVSALRNWSSAWLWQLFGLPCLLGLIVLTLMAKLAA